MAEKTLSTRGDELTTRMSKLEGRLSSAPPSRQINGRPRAQQYCSVPELPERQFGRDVSVERARLIRVISKKWVNGTHMHYYFFEDPPWTADDAQKEVVRRAFEVWKEVGIGLKFSEVASPADAEIRIGFQQGDGAWSYVGRDILNQGPLERTMNLGWDLTRPGEIDTAKCAWSSGRCRLPPKITTPTAGHFSNPLRSRWPQRPDRDKMT